MEYLAARDLEINRKRKEDKCCYYFGYWMNYGTSFDTYQKERQVFNNKCGGNMSTLFTSQFC